MELTKLTFYTHRLSQYVTKVQYNLTNLKACHQKNSLMIITVNGFIGIWIEVAYRNNF